jgi:hypothetical protein
MQEERDVEKMKRKKKWGKKERKMTKLSRHYIVNDQKLVTPQEHTFSR